MAFFHFIEKFQWYSIL